MKSIQLGGVLVKKVKQLAQSGMTYDRIDKFATDFWKPEQPDIAPDPKVNGKIPKNRLARILRMDNGKIVNAYTQKETAVAWAMLVNAARKD